MGLHASVTACGGLGSSGRAVMFCSMDLATGASCLFFVDLCCPELGRVFSFVSRGQAQGRCSQKYAEEKCCRWGDWAPLSPSFPVWLTVTVTVRYSRLFFLLFPNSTTAASSRGDFAIKCSAILSIHSDLTKIIFGQFHFCRFMFYMFFFSAR